MTVTIDLRLFRAVSGFTGAQFKGRSHRASSWGVLIEATPLRTIMVGIGGPCMAVAQVACSNTESGQWVLHTDAANAFRASRKHGEVNHAALSHDDQLSTITFEGVDVLVPRVPGEYPDWRRIMPAYTSGGTMDIDFETAGIWQKIAKANALGSPMVCANGKETAMVRFSGDQDIVGFWAPQSKSIYRDHHADGTHRPPVWTDR